MDHLPKPIGGEHPRVPLHAPIRTYEPEELSALPSKYGYEDIPNLVEYGVGPDMNGRLINEFLQSWLVFALLAQVLNQSVETNDFLYGDGQAHLHTTGLSSLIQQWVQREHEESGRAKSGMRFQWVDGEDRNGVQAVSHGQKTR